MTETEYAALLDTVDPVELGARIKYARKGLVLTQSEVANPVATGAYLSRLEDGQRRPSLPFLTHVATRLGVSLDWLLTGEEDSTPLPAALEEAQRRVAQLEDRVDFLDGEMTELRRRFARMEELLREQSS